MKKNVLSAAFMGIFCAVANSLALDFNDANGSTNRFSSSTNVNEVIIGQDKPNNHVYLENQNTSGDAWNVAWSVDLGQLSSATNSLLSVENGGRLIIGSADTNNLPDSGILVGDGDLRVGYDSKVITDELLIGVGNETGSITVKNDGLLEIKGGLTVGSTNSENNVVSVNNGGELLISETTNLVVRNIEDATENLNSVNIGDGGSLLIKGDVHAQDFASQDGVTFESGATLGVGGELTTAKNAIEDGMTLLLDDNLSTNHTAYWNAESIKIGKTTSNNSLLIENGAKVFSTNSLTLGTDDAANNNTVTASGSNSALTVTGTTFVGSDGDNNSITIEDGATLNVSGEIKIGASIQGSNNSLTLSGTGTVASAAADVYVGDTGKNSTLNIEDGASADFQENLILGNSSKGNRLNASGTNTQIDVAEDFIIGVQEEASGNAGSDTTGSKASIYESAALNIGQNLTVGKDGGGSILLINNEAIVNVASNAVIGENSGDNYIFLEEGSNAQFNVGGDLIVGNSEDGDNRFAVYGGTANIDGSLYLGTSTNQHESKNYIHLETTNAVLNVANALYVGTSNSINTLDLRKGATLNTTDLLIGAYEGTSNNVVTVDGTDSLISVSNQLVIGSASGTNNTVTLKNGGILEVAQENINIGGTNSMLYVQDGGILKTLGWDFNAQTNLATNIVFDAGSTLHMLGTLSGTNMVEGGLNFILDGATASWDTGTNILYVGNESGDNSLSLTNGASASTLTNLYIGFTTAENMLTVGTNSTLTVGADLFVGTETNSSARNTLAVLGAADVAVGNDMFVYRASTLKIDSISQINVTGDYEQDGWSSLEIGISSNQVDPNLVVGGNAGFESANDTSEDGSIIKIINEGINESNTITIVQAGSITVDGETATGGSIESNIHSNSLLGFTVSISNANDLAYIVLDDFIVRSIGESGNLEGQELAVANEIEDMKALGISNAIEMVEFIQTELTPEEINEAFADYYGEKESSVPANNVINMGMQNVADQLTIRADNTRSRMGVATAAVDWSKQPGGAAGPHETNQELQGWISGYATRGTQDSADGFNGYDGNIGGFMIGADFSVAENILVGVAGGTGSGSIDKDNGSSTDTKTTYLALYGSMGTESWFGDMSLIYGGSEIDSTLGTTFDTTADYDAKNIAFYLGGGKEIIGKYFIFTPQASVLANSYKQDAYTEDASNAVGREVDSFDALYLQTALGCSMGMYMGSENFTFKPEIRAYWMHEWNGDDETIGYNLIDGTGGDYVLALQAPEEDILKIGIGASAKFGDYLELRADLDSRQSANYSDYTLLGSLRYQF